MQGINNGNQAVAYWAVEDIQDVTNHFINCGATLIQPITNVGGSTQTAIIADPFGNHLGFIEGA
jgi:predicted enzyme related to lactoylglutathione lyase